MSDPVARLNAALEGRYRVERRLGEGGMATVYRADDLRHERKVALKVLKPELAAVVGADRFLAEIKTTANLQHPHILPLFDSGEADSFLFYVMPYMDGESLRERLDRDHQLPVDEAVKIATNVAEALGYAHSHGVIHRDIKPANILLQAGKPVVSDFGIALALGAAGAGRLTETGLSLGTPHYMSPEQATGDLSIGAASDIYALGCVLYEMLVGSPPFVGSTPQAVLGKIIAGDAPSARAERQSVPANVDGAIRKALEKVPADRFSSTGELVRALDDGDFRHGDEVGSTTRAGGRGGPWNPLSVAATVLAIVSTLGLGWALSSVGSASREPLRRLYLPTRPDVLIAASGGGAFDVAPDGSAVVYVGRSPDGSQQAWLQRLDRLEPEPIRGTEEARGISFSPDGASLVFQTGTSMRTVSVAGGATNTVVDDVTPSGSASVAWSADGWLYYSRPGEGVWRVPADGGPEEQLIPSGGNDYQHFDALPNGRGLLLTRNLGTQREDSIAVLDLETRRLRTLFLGAMARYAESGHILYSAGDGQLIARPFDQDRLELTGPGRTIVDRVIVNAGSVAMFGLSESGILVYLSDAAGDETVPVWIGRDGSEEVLDERLKGRFGRPAISPDGRRVAFEATLGDDNGADIWIYDLEGGGLSQFTNEGTNQRPFWSVDGTQLGFSSNRERFLGIYGLSADGLGPVRLLKAPDGGGTPWEGVWTPDGGLIYRHGSNIQGGDISFLPDPSNGPAQPIVQTPTEESAMSLSPDGHWLAYQVVEGGESRVYVQPFPGPGRREIIGVGRRPRWSRSGELFYISGDSQSWVAAQVRLESVASALGFQESVATHNYDITPDGQRILAIRPATSGTNVPVVVLNFFEELKRLVPVD